MNQQEIETQAKAIMDSFLKELGSVNEPQAFGVQRDAQMRAPKQQQVDEQFRQLFLENAPKVKDSLLVMERKQW